MGKVVVESVCRLLFSVDTQPRRAHGLPFGSIVGYTFRRHKLRFMSNAKLRTTTLLRYGSSSQKSAAHIFGNPDLIFASRLFPKLRPLMADEIVRSFSYNLLILARKRSLIFFITDLKVHFGISRNAIFNCLLLLHNKASLFLSKNKKIRTNANRPLNGNLLRAD